MDDGSESYARSEEFQAWLKQRAREQLHLALLVDHLDSQLELALPELMEGERLSDVRVMMPGRVTRSQLNKLQDMYRVNWKIVGQEREGKSWLLVIKPIGLAEPVTLSARLAERVRTDAALEGMGLETYLESLINAGMPVPCKGVQSSRQRLGCCSSRHDARTTVRSKGVA